MSFPQTFPAINQESMPGYNLFLQFQKNRDKEIRDELIITNMDLVCKLARRYTNKGISLENLVSVGTIGLITAVDNYDLSRKVKFVTYASHCILGEIKRSFRDTSWKVRVPRRLKELNSTVQAAITKLSQEFKRSPTIEEIATHLNLSQEKVIEAIEVNHAYNPVSLDTASDGNKGNKGFLYDILSLEDQNFKKFLAHYDLDKLLGKLAKREQVIVCLFYYKELSQAKIAERLGLSQMHVSRLLRQAMANLKSFRAPAA